MLVGNKVDRVSPLLSLALSFIAHFSIFFVACKNDSNASLSCSVFMMLFFIHIFLFQEVERVVTKEEGMALAKELGCLFLECSAKTRENVEQSFEELVLKVDKRHYCLFLIYMQCSSKVEVLSSLLKRDKGLLTQWVLLYDFRQIMEVPRLLEEGSNVIKRNILKQKQEHQTPPSGGCCS